MNKINPQLIVNFSKNDRRAAEILFNQLRRPLFGYLFRMSNDSFVAEDLLQETLLTIHERIETYNQDYEFMPWAYTIARNKFFEFKRSQTRVIRVFSIDQNDFENCKTGCFSEQLDISADIKKALNSLSEPVKEAFVLKHFQGLTFNEVAELQEIPIPTAKSRVLFAVRKVREYMNRGEKS